MADAVANKPKHPEFEVYFNAHRGLIFYMAKKLAPRFHCHYRELVGSLTFWFNYVLYNFDPGKGKFSSFYCRKCFAYLLRVWMRRESQAWSNFVSMIASTDADMELSERNFAQHEVNFHLYRMPEEDETDVDDIIDFFEGVDECWEFMTRHLDQTDKQMLQLYFRDGWEQWRIGEKFKVSKERVRQRLERAKCQIRVRIKQVSALAHLFAEDEEKAPRGLTYTHFNKLECTP